MEKSVEGYVVVYQKEGEEPRMTHLPVSPPKYNMRDVLGRASIDFAAEDMGMHVERFTMIPSDETVVMNAMARLFGPVNVIAFARTADVASEVTA